MYKINDYEKEDFKRITNKDGLNTYFIKVNRIYVEVDKEAKKGTYTRYPERNELFTSQPINELLVVEFYNR